MYTNQSDRKFDISLGFIDYIPQLYTTDIYLFRISFIKYLT